MFGGSKGTACFVQIVKIGLKILAVCSCAVVGSNSTSLRLLLRKSSRRIGSTFPRSTRQTKLSLKCIILRGTGSVERRSRLTSIAFVKLSLGSLSSLGRLIGNSPVSIAGSVAIRSLWRFVVTDSCMSCWKGRMLFVKIVVHFDGGYKMYRCDVCGHVAERKLGSY